MYYAFVQKGDVDLLSEYKKYRNKLNANLKKLGPATMVPFFFYPT